jgi:hypothetical protein
MATLCVSMRHNLSSKAVSRLTNRSGYLYPYCMTQILNYPPYQYTAYECNTYSAIIYIEGAGGHPSVSATAVTPSSRPSQAAEITGGNITYICGNGSNCGNNDSNGGNNNKSAGLVTLPAKYYFQLLSVVWIFFLIWCG